ncbi:hypothetical protein RJ639_030246 [Escallonia herrerae]|uniref:Uncharacterized protein n=1 Tax=Escallonia herrerae TaxID=1293975 RepID=A0AA89BHG2_9ASTE|nr:hypothetical protein RJ639_030246 [Escallonia herrerae]
MTGHWKQTRRPSPGLMRLQRSTQTLSPIPAISTWIYAIHYYRKKSFYGQTQKIFFFLHLQIPLFKLRNMKDDGVGRLSLDRTMATSETNPESGPVNPNMQHSGGTVYVTPYVAPAHGSVGLCERPKKFNGKDFKRWQQKMLFYLTTLNLARSLQEDAPDLGENPDRQTVAAVDAWKHSDFLCKNYILNGLDSALYNVYSPMVNAKALWESLERKYKTKDAGSKKFVVGKFLDFKMVDSKTVISQVQEF